MSSAANHALGNWGNQTMAWAEDDMKIVQEMAAKAGIGLPQSRAQPRGLPGAEATALPARRIRPLTAQVTGPPSWILHAPGSLGHCKFY